MENKQKYALVTGATMGIGYELARLFAQDQYNLVIVARSQQELSTAAAEFKQHGIDVVPIAKDLSEQKGPFEVYDEIKAKGIQIDVLVNNAAQGEYGKFIDTDLNHELEIVDLNIKGYLVLTKFFLKEMVARNEGKILMVTSIAGEMPGPWQAVYHGTKAFVTTFTEAIQNEVKDTNVTITKLLPGPTDTGFFEKADMKESKIVQEGKLADPATVAKDGYEALMAGDSQVISGMKNKATVAASKVMPDKTVAETMNKQAKPVDEKSKK
ncbi:SDR family NAD(P)-dependent oxidoreductase [Pontibacter diazotrophicus]|uniref:SDR family NAD(P)-dependent oxidoreductase n=1 Tax=Pontibacter diazotrophicus TaxID=1400979 RepID=A0A3D8LE39_9BACT|nr:SDR family oxidoreductase [Pontibacter diazotrophicus]RDV15544.1 SDR family NAD(P)-dependent oxidoreductase [Pontibacter diazotrophicus]